MQKSLDVLCVDLANAKADESRANEARVAIECDILAITGVPDEGTKTVDADGWKIKIEQKVNRKLDQKAWSLIADQIPEELHPIKIVEEIKIENKGVQWLKENEPGYYKLLCTAMSEKPAKPSVKVEANDEVK